MNEPEADAMNNYTLEYWRDDDWYVGRLREVPGVFSQGQTLAELEENIKEVYLLMIEEQEPIPLPALTKEIRL
jgi:predicted RNase H-like HicB family nuclease